MKPKLVLGLIVFAAWAGVVFAAPATETALEEFGRMNVDLVKDPEQVDIAYTPMPKIVPSVPQLPSPAAVIPASAPKAEAPSDTFQYAKRFAELTASNNSLSKQNVSLRVQIDRLKNDLEKQRQAKITARANQARLKKKVGELGNALSISIRKFEAVELQKIRSSLSQIKKAHDIAAAAKTAAERKLAVSETRTAELAARADKLEAEWSRLKVEHQAVAMIQVGLEKRVNSLRAEKDRAADKIRMLGESGIRGVQRIRRVHGLLKNAHAESRRTRRALEAAQKSLLETRGRESHLSKQVSQMAAGLRSAAEQLRALKEANRKLEARVGSLVSSNERLAAETASLKKETQAMTGKMAELEAAKEGLSKLRRAGEKEKTRLTARLRQIYGRLSDSVRDRESADSARTALESELQGAKAGEAAARLKAEQTATQLALTERALEAIQETHHELSRDLNGFKHDKVQIENQLASVQASKRQTEAELQSHKQALSEFQKRFDEINLVNRQLLETIQGILKDSKNRVE